jgi:hypothetical protein
MTFKVLEPEDWRHDVVARPIATLNATPEQLEKKLGGPLIYDESDFVPRYFTVVALSDQDGQIGFERYEGGPKPEFVVTAIGSGMMPVEQLRGIFGFHTKAWTQLEPEDYKPTPIERALEQWHQAKQDQLKNKQKAGEALLAMRDAGLSYRGMAKILGLSSSRVNQLVSEAGGTPEARTKAALAKKAVKRQLATLSGAKTQSQRATAKKTGSPSARRVK